MHKTINKKQTTIYTNIAHELSTPLTVIIEQCEYMKRHAPLLNTKDFTTAINSICSHAKNIHQTLMQLIKIQRLADGHETINIEAINLEDLLYSICEDEKYKCNNLVTFIVSSQVKEIYADIALMFILLRCLIGNAVKYSIQNSFPKKNIVKISAFHKGQIIFIAIKDYGCGIPQEDLNHIFTPFYRAKNTKQYKGSGLGLSIAEQIACIHGGNITVKSTLGRGSTFTLTFPDVSP